MVKLVNIFPLNRDIVSKENAERMMGNVRICGLVVSIEHGCKVIPLIYSVNPW